MEWSLHYNIVQMVLMTSVLLFTVFYLYVTQNYNYWKRKGVPYLKPLFPFGNSQDLALGKIHNGKFYEGIYTKFKGKRFGGFFELGTPVLIINDLDLVKQVLTKDFDHFVDRAVPKTLPFNFLAKNLFTIEGEEWKNLRYQLSPTFSSSRMKLMFKIIENKTHELKEYLGNILAFDSKTIDVKDITSRFHLDVIAACAMGLEVNCIKDAKADFFKSNKIVFQNSFLKSILIQNFPKVANYFKVTLLGKNVIEFVLYIVENTVSYRKNNNIYRNDFMDLLMTAKNMKDTRNNSSTRNNELEGLTTKEMAGHVFKWFIAGSEIVGSVTAFVLYVLAWKPEVQDRLRQEVDTKLKEFGGQMTYQALKEMVFMEQVIFETIRLLRSVPSLHRKCVKPYRIPGTNVVLDKGTKVVIPLYAINHDPQIHVNPQEFDPDRFSEENIKNRHRYAFLPFGEGPRHCLGKRLAMMQLKAGLSSMVANFEFSVTEETLIPMEISPKILFPTPMKPIKLNISVRST